MSEIRVKIIAIIQDDVEDDGQRAVARIIGTSQPHLSKVLSGKVYTGLGTLVKYVELLGYRVDIKVVKPR